MTEKRIRNDQWYVKNLIAKIINHEVDKPKFQRKRRWNTLPKKGKKNIPSERKYIDFLMQTHNSVHAITFGQSAGNIKKYSNIDGNNRINAIAHFLDEPFTLYPEYLIDIYAFIDKSFDKTVTESIKNIFAELTYADLMTFKYNKYFENIGEKGLYDQHLKFKRDEIEPYIETLQKCMKTSQDDRFDNDVLINVTLFEGYTTEELCKIFEDINQYNSPLTEIELMACRLYNITNFRINNNVIKVSIQEALKQFYIKKNAGEALECFKYEDSEQMNAYDFMVGFQNHIHAECPMIEETDSDGISLFFKLYKTMYKGSFDNTFTSENINEFIDKVMEAKNILNRVRNDVFTENLTASAKIFETCNKKLSSLKKNNIYIIIIAIIGYINAKTDINEILRSIELSILFHFLVKDIANKDDKLELQCHDIILYEAGGNYIDNQADKIYKTPRMISEKIKEDIMKKTITLLMRENIKTKQHEVRPNGKDKQDKRRNRKFYEKTLIYYYYKNKVPTDLLQHKYWIEHICPFSSSWEKELDIERLGNIIPIISELNSKRGTKHISEYKKHDKNKFIEYIKYIIPDDALYDKLISRQEAKPHIINAEVYNTFCERNEKIYMDTFINCLFKGAGPPALL